MSDRLTCIKCGKTYNMLAEGICFFCDQKHWDAYFKRILGDKKR